MRLAALVLVLVGCSADPDLAELESGACDGVAMTLATFNIRFDNPDDGNHRWTNRRANVLDQITDMAPDLLAVQEALDGQVLELEAGLSGFAREGVGRDDGVRAGEYAPLFYRATRFTRRDGGTFWLSPTPDHFSPPEALPWGTKLNRIATWLLLDDAWAGDSVLVLSAHFDHQSAEARRESARIIVDFVAAHPADHVVVMGDLNARTDSEPHRILAQATASDGAPRLVDAADLALTTRGNLLGTTLTTWRTLGAPSFHVDHVFVSPDVAVDEYAVQHRRDHYDWGWRYTSDHLPVRVTTCR